VLNPRIDDHPEIVLFPLRNREFPDENELLPLKFQPVPSPDEKGKGINVMEEFQINNPQEGSLFCDFDTNLWSELPQAANSLPIIDDFHNPLNQPFGNFLSVP